MLHTSNVNLNKWKSKYNKKRNLLSLLISELWAQSKMIKTNRLILLVLIHCLTTRNYRQSSKTITTIIVPIRTSRHKICNCITHIILRSPNTIWFTKITSNINSSMQVDTDTTTTRNKSMGIKDILR